MAPAMKPVSSSISWDQSRAAKSTVEDLTHLPGPITEAAIIKVLASRFEAKNYQVKSQSVILKYY
jgi:hypothetical protein